MNPTDLKYTKDHEWVRLEGDTAVVGITDYAQRELGDVVFVDLPDPGSEVKQGETFGVVESVKAASDLYAPLSGTVEAKNEALQDTPDLINAEPVGAGWMLRVRASNPAEIESLMDAHTYEEYVKGLH